MGILVAETFFTIFIYTIDMMSIIVGTRYIYTLHICVIYIFEMHLRAQARRKVHVTYVQQ
jgi:hypothetical protein